MFARFGRSGAPRILVGCVGVDGQRVNATSEFRRQQRIYHAMAVDPALPFERIRHNMYPEMGFAARPVAGMTFMQMRFVDDVEAFGMESLPQLMCDVIFGCHDMRNIVGYSLRSMPVSFAVL